jgi:hypothetical protein
LLRSQVLRLFMLISWGAETRLRCEAEWDDLAASWRVVILSGVGVSGTPALTEQGDAGERAGGRFVSGGRRFQGSNVGVVGVEEGHWPKANMYFSVSIAL